MRLMKKAIALFSMILWTCSALAVVGVDTEGLGLADFLREKEAARMFKCISTDFHRNIWSDSQSRDARQVLILQTKKRYEVYVGGEKLRSDDRFPIKGAQIAEDGNTFLARHQDSNIFYPTFIQLFLHKGKGGGSFYSRQTNGIAGTLGDRDVYIQSFTFTGCTVHSPPEKFSWYDYFSSY